MGYAARVMPAAVVATVAALLSTSTALASAPPLGTCLHAHGLTVGYYNPSVPTTGPDHVAKPTLVPPRWNYAKAGPLDISASNGVGNYDIDPRPLPSPPPSGTPILAMYYTAHAEHGSGRGWRFIGHFWVAWLHEPARRVDAVLACVRAHPDG